MDVGTATLIVTGLTVLKEIIKSSNEPIVDSNGHVVAGDIREFKAQKSDEIFKKHFGDVTLGDIEKDIKEGEENLGGNS